MLALPEEKQEFILVIPFEQNYYMNWIGAGPISRYPTFKNFTITGIHKNCPLKK
jgi:hypothetical protein